MTKERFTENFKLLIVHLRDITERFCFNDLSENYHFIIEPSDRGFVDHLNDEEKQSIKTWNKLKNIELSFDQVIELFYKNGKTPKWADCTIYQSDPEKTVIRIYFSRQFCNEEEIYYMNLGTGPFKAMVETNLKNSENAGEKFDVNWKSNLQKNKLKDL